MNIRTVFITSKIICIVGESGSGKDTVASILETSYNLIPLKSYTTRKPRYENEDTHIFISKEESKNYTDKVASTFFDNNLYFATTQQVDNSDIYIIDVDGIYTLRARYKGEKEVIVVYLRTSKIKRFIRLCKRDGFIKALHRLNHDKYAFRFVNEVADYVVDNKGKPYEAANIIYNLFKGGGE